MKYVEYFIFLLNSKMINYESNIINTDTSYSYLNLLNFIVWMIF